MANRSTGNSNQSFGRILRLVLEHGRMTKPDIATRLSLSLPTVSQNVALLLDSGYLAYDDTPEPTGGRKAQAVVPVPDAHLALGLDITAHQVRGVLLDLQGCILASFSKLLPFADTPAYFEQLQEQIAAFLKTHQVAAPQLLGTGIAIPGVLSPDGHMLIRSHVLHVENMETSSFFGTFPGQRAICNDAKAAALAELWQRKELGTAVYLSLSDSVGGALVIDNHIYNGCHCHGGEFGHMTLVPDGRHCYCGQYGCLDAYCNATVLSCHADSLQQFFEVLAAGDAACTRLWHRYAEHLAMAINSIVTMLDCPVILGGFVGAQLSDTLLQELLQRVQERSTFGVQGNLLLCLHRHNTAAVGAALQLIRRFLQTGYQQILRTSQP